MQVVPKSGKLPVVNAEDAVTGLYQRLITGWNDADAETMAAAVAHDGIVIGFDGSQMVGREAVATERAHLRRP